MAGQKPFWILTSSFASARFQHFWVRRGQALAFSAKTWNLFLLDRSPESPTSSKIPPKSASIHYLQRNDQDTHGFRSPKSVTRVKLSQKDACSPFQATLVGGLTHFCSVFLFIFASFLSLSALLLHSIPPLISAAILPHPPAPVYSILSIARHHAPGILSLRRRGFRRWASAPCRGHWQQRQHGRRQRGWGPSAGFRPTNEEFE